MSELQWIKTPGKHGPLSQAATELGQINVRPKSYGNLGIKWTVEFPGGATFRAENEQRAKEYAQDWLRRKLNKSK